MKYSCKCDALSGEGGERRCVFIAVGLGAMRFGRAKSLYCSLLPGSSQPAVYLGAPPAFSSVSGAGTVQMRWSCATQCHAARATFAAGGGEPGIVFSAAIRQAAAGPGRDCDCHTSVTGVTTRIGGPTCPDCRAVSRPAAVAMAPSHKTCRCKTCPTRPHLDPQPHMLHAQCVPPLGVRHNSARVALGAD